MLETSLNESQLWKGVLTEIELSVSRATFSTWFKDTGIVSHNNGVFVVGAPNEFVRKWLEEKYEKTILKLLREKHSAVRSIEFIISQNKPVRQRIIEQKSVESLSELPLSDYYINKQDNLNSRYTFSSFIIGTFNELAFAASQAVVKRPGMSYNPLFIYGSTGHGKTHLIQAVGNEIKKNNTKKRIFYVTSEQFAMDTVNALQNNRANEFKEKYRAFDVLIMDDIQFLAKKQRTQEELFHLFNIFFDNNKQTIFSSDKDPSSLPDIEDRLISRFSAGMVVEIPPPDHESRVSILKSKTQNVGVELNVDVLEYLATILPGSIRDLEGAVNLILCNQQLKNTHLSLSDVKNILKERVRPKRVVPIETVVKTIADFYGINESIIYEKTRRKEVVKPRQMIMYVLREDFNTSYPTIGQTLGGRDHTTVIHSCDKVKEELKENVKLSKELQEIRALLS